MDRLNDLRDSGNGGNRSVLFSFVVLQVYPRASEKLRRMLRAFVTSREGGPQRSLTIREILRRHYRVDIGLYSLWPYGLKPAIYQPGTRVGRYSFLSDTVRTFTRNHPMNTKSTHGIFYNPKLGKSATDLLPKAELWIGNGVWLGHNAIILPPTQQIGDGAIIRPGAVVFSNVPPYAIVSGHPARITGYRFSSQTISRLNASHWWENTPDAVEAIVSPILLAETAASEDSPKLRS